MSVRQESNSANDGRSAGRIRVPATGITVRNDHGVISVDIATRWVGEPKDASEDVLLELSRDEAERLLIELRSRLDETPLSLNPDDMHVDTSTDDAPRPRGIPFHEMGLTREEFDAAADEFAFMAPYWDRDDMDEYGDLLKR